MSNGTERERLGTWTTLAKLGDTKARTIIGLGRVGMGEEDDEREAKYDAGMLPG